MRRVALTIAGTDSGGGAGVAADLKTFEAHGLWGACAVTAVTAQNTQGVQAWAPVEPELVRAQIAAVVSDLAPAAAKTGMLGSLPVTEAVCQAVRDFGVQPLVVDPVMISSAGSSLLEEQAIETVWLQLLPMATVVTPNLDEAAALCGFPIRDRATMEEAGRYLSGVAGGVVMITGGHLEDEAASPDLLVAGGELRWVEGARIPSPHTHGGGCVLSAAVCAELARGMDPVDACIAGKRFVERAIAAGASMGGVGAGVGPVDPGWGGPAS